MRCPSSVVRRPSFRPSSVDVVRAVARVTARSGKAAVLAAARDDADASGVVASSASSGVAVEAESEMLHDMRNQVERQV